MISTLSFPAHSLQSLTITSLSLGVCHLMLAHGAEKPVVLAPEETLALPTVLAVAALLALVCQAITRIFEALPRTTIRGDRGAA